MPQVPATSEDALRLAIKLALDAGEYDRAAALLDVLRRTPPRRNVVPIDLAGEPKEELAP